MVLFLKGDGIEVSFNGSRDLKHTNLVYVCFVQVDLSNAHLTQRKGCDRAASESAGL